MGRLQTDTSRWRIALLCSGILFSGCVVRDVAAGPDQERAKEDKLQHLLHASTISFRQGTEDGMSQAASAIGYAYELSPRDPRVLDALGCLAVRKKDFSESKDWFEKALLAAPKYDRAAEHLAFVAESEGDTVRAKEWYLRALLLNPTNFRARNNFVQLLRREHDPRYERFLHHEFLKVRSDAEDDIVVEFNNQGFDERALP